MKSILVVNAGSSSLKFQVFESAGPDRLKRHLKGQIEGIGSKPRLRIEDREGQVLADQVYSPESISDLPAAMREAGSWLARHQVLDLLGVGHRVVHGGPTHHLPVLITREILAQLERYISLAPLHQPNNLAPIRNLLAERPDLPQVACFDTAFHHGHTAVTDHYAIPSRFYDEGVRRYGFHGLSYEYVASRLRQIAPRIAD